MLIYMKNVVYLSGINRRYCYIICLFGDYRQKSGVNIHKFQICTANIDAKFWTDRRHGENWLKLMFQNI